MMASGLYIVTLNNEEPISVNANDPRIAGRCVRVTKAHCKFGKAQNLNVRKRNYDAVFGAKNVNFLELVELEDIRTAERLVLKGLDVYRIRGRRGHRNEWLENISAQQVERIAIDALMEASIQFKQVGSFCTKHETSICS